MNKFFRLITKGDQRAIKAKKNIIASFFLKGFNILLNFAIIPITLSYLDEVRYGVWFTISSFIAWFYFFDIGLGNGLRNKLTETLANKNFALAKIYVSTTYAILIVISVLLLLIFYLIFPFINWAQIFNVPDNLATEVRQTVFVVFLFFNIRFVLNIIISIHTAYQMPAYKDLFGLLGNLLALTIIFFLIRHYESSIVLLSSAMMLAPILVLFLGSIIFFYTDYKVVRPSIRKIKFKYVKDLFNLGIQFFIIQISAIILFSTDNIIITQLFGPSEVTPYNIANRYVGVMLIFFSIIVTPYWSAITDAYSKKDIIWIRSIIRKLKKIWYYSTFGVLMLLLFSNWFYKMWIGENINIPFILTFIMCLYVVAVNWISIYVHFLNGTGKVRIQLYHAIFVGIINIPLSIIFAKFLGITGVILATLVCQLVAVFGHQYNIKK